MDVQQCLCSALLYQKTFRYQHVVVAALIKAQYRRYDWVSPIPSKAIISVLPKKIKITSSNTWFWLLSLESGSIPSICAFLIWPSQKNSEGPDVLFASIFSSITVKGDLCDGSCCSRQHSIPSMWIVLFRRPTKDAQMETVNVLPTSIL